MYEEGAVCEVIGLDISEYENIQYYWISTALSDITIDNTDYNSLFILCFAEDIQKFDKSIYINGTEEQEILLYSDHAMEYGENVAFHNIKQVKIISRAASISGEIVEFGTHPCASATSSEIKYDAPFSGDSISFDADCVTVNGDISSPFLSVKSLWFEGNSTLNISKQFDLLVQYTISFNEGFRYTGKAQYNIMSPEGGQTANWYINSSEFIPDKDSPHSIIKVQEIILDSVGDLELITTLLNNKNLTKDNTKTLAESIEKKFRVRSLHWMEQMIQASGDKEAYTPDCYSFLDSCFTWEYSKVMYDRIKNLSTLYISHPISVDISYISSTGGRLAFVGQFNNLQDKVIKVEADGIITLDIIKIDVKPPIREEFIKYFRSVIQPLVWLLDEEQNGIISEDNIRCTEYGCNVKPKILSILPAISVLGHNGKHFNVERNFRYSASYQSGTFDDFLEEEGNKKEREVQQRIKQVYNNSHRSSIQVADHHNTGIVLQLMQSQSTLNIDQSIENLDTYYVELPNSNQYITTYPPHLPIDYQIKVLHPSSDYPSQLMGSEKLLARVLYVEELDPAMFKMDQLLFKYDRYAEYDALVVLLKNFVSIQGISVKADEQLYSLIKKYFFNTIDYCKTLRGFKDCKDLLLKPLPFTPSVRKALISKTIIWPILHEDGYITAKIYWATNDEIQEGHISDGSSAALVIGDGFAVSETIGTLMPYSSSDRPRIIANNNAVLAGNIFATQPMDIVCEGNAYATGYITSNDYVGFKGCENKLYALNSYWQVGSLGIPSAGDLMLSNTYISFRDSLDISAQQVDLESVTIVSAEGKTQIAAGEELTLNASQIDAATVIIKLDNGCVNLYKGSSIHGTRVTMDQQDCDFVYEGQNIHADELLEMFAQNITTHRLWEEDSKLALKAVHNIIIQTLTKVLQIRGGHATHILEKAGISAEALYMEAGGDIVTQGAILDVIDYIGVKAGGAIKMLPIALYYEMVVTAKRYFARTTGAAIEHTEINIAAGEMFIEADQPVEMVGVQVVGDKLVVHSNVKIALKEAQDWERFEERIKKRRYGGWGGHKINTDLSFASQAIPTRIEIHSSEESAPVIESRGTIYKGVVDKNGNPATVVRNAQSIINDCAENVSSSYTETFESGFSSKGGLASFGTKDKILDITHTTPVCGVFSDVVVYNTAESLTNVGTTYIDSTVINNVARIEDLAAAERIKVGYSENFSGIGVGFSSPEAGKLGVQAGAVNEKLDYTQNAGIAHPVQYINTNVKLIGCESYKRVGTQIDGDIIDLSCLHNEVYVARNTFHSKTTITEAHAGIFAGAYTNIPNIINQIKNLMEMTKGRISPEDMLNIGNSLNILDQALAGQAIGKIGVFIEGGITKQGISQSSSTVIAATVNSTTVHIENTESITEESYQVNAQGDLVFHTDEWVSKSASNHSSQSYKRQDFSFHIPIEGNSLDVKYSNFKTSSSEEIPVYTVFNVGGTADIRVTGTLRGEGLQVDANELYVDVGQLVLRSLCAKSSMKTESQNVSAGLSFGEGSSALTGGSLGGLKAKYSSCIHNPSFLVGRDVAEVKAEVLHLAGAMIANAEKSDNGSFTDKGQLKLHVSNFILENLEDFAKGYTIGISTGFSTITSNEKMQDGVRQVTTTSRSFTPTVGYQDQTGEVRATIGGTTEDSSAIPAGADRDINNMQEKLKGINVSPVSWAFEKIVNSTECLKGTCEKPIKREEGSDNVLVAYAENIMGQLNSTLSGFGNIISNTFNGTNTSDISNNSSVVSNKNVEVEKVIPIESADVVSEESKTPSTEEDEVNKGQKDEQAEVVFVNYIENDNAQPVVFDSEGMTPAPNGQENTGMTPVEKTDSVENIRLENAIAALKLSPEVEEEFRVLYLKYLKDGISGDIKQEDYAESAKTILRKNEPISHTVVRLLMNSGYYKYSLYNPYSNSSQWNGRDSILPLQPEYEGIFSDYADIYSTPAMNAALYVAQEKIDANKKPQTLSEISKQLHDEVIIPYTSKMLVLMMERFQTDEQLQKQYGLDGDIEQHKEVLGTYFEARNNAPRNIPGVILPGDEGYDGSFSQFFSNALLLSSYDSASSGNPMLTSQGDEVIFSLAQPENPDNRFSECPNCLNSQWIVIKNLLQEKMKNNSPRTVLNWRIFIEDIWDPSVHATGKAMLYPFESTYRSIRDLAKVTNNRGAIAKFEESVLSALTQAINFYIENTNENQKEFGRDIASALEVLGMGAVANDIKMTWRKWVKPNDLSVCPAPSSQYERESALRNPDLASSEPIITYAEGTEAMLSDIGRTGGVEKVVSDAISPQGTSQVSSEAGSLSSYEKESILKNPAFIYDPDVIHKPILSLTDDARMEFLKILQSQPQIFSEINGELGRNLYLESLALLQDQPFETGFLATQMLNIRITTTDELARLFFFTQDGSVDLVKRASLSFLENNPNGIQTLAEALRHNDGVPLKSRAAIAEAIVSRIDSFEDKITFLAEALHPDLAIEQISQRFLIDGKIPKDYLKNLSQDLAEQFRNQTVTRQIFAGDVIGKLKPVGEGRLDHRYGWAGDFNNSMLMTNRVHNGPLKEDLMLFNFNDQATPWGNTAGTASLKWGIHEEIGKKLLAEMDKVYSESIAKGMTNAEADAASELVVRKRLALLKIWGNRDAVTVIKIPKGTDVLYFSGRAEIQVHKMGEGTKETVIEAVDGGGFQMRFFDFNYRYTKDGGWILGDFKVVDNELIPWERKLPELPEPKGD